jgi:thiol-disulfide isomerase/thioredoxin
MITGRLLVLALLLLTAPAQGSDLVPWPAGRPTPALALPDLDGHPQDLAALRGQVVLLNFWASWCRPCVEEMPSLQALAAGLAGVPFRVIGIDVGEGPHQVRHFLEQVGVDLPVWLDGDGVAALAWQARVLPTSVMIDAAGRARYRVVGAIDWDREEIREAVRGLLSRP